MSGVRVSPPVQNLFIVAGLVGYFQESYSELVNKVSWPTWKDLQTSSIVVLIASIIIALTVWLMDYIFGVNAILDPANGDFAYKGVLGYFYNMFLK